MQRLLRRCSFADLDGDEYSSDDDPDQEEDRLLGIADQQLSKAFMDGSWGPIASALDHLGVRSLHQEDPVFGLDRRTRVRC